ncbi:hypothetical protein E4U60_004069 [Claviceps pazoutovae]|uniref:Uncharacterized protein n=1 Tax=Claviceps pazoutovae TaxID=1649127 RepID=A0A9P7M9N4_9HYPO|nr:hypothetical protein E4U60_004069 [Claviceps pazoutovae]
MLEEASEDANKALCGSHGALFQQRSPVMPRPTAPQSFRKSQDRSGGSPSARGKLENEMNISFHRLESKPTTLRTVIIEDLRKANVLIYSPKKLHRRLFPKSTVHTELRGQPLSAIMNVPDGDFATCTQSLTFEDIVGYLR